MRVTTLDARGETWHRFPEFLPDGTISCTWRGLERPGAVSRFARRPREQTVVRDRRSRLIRDAGLRPLRPARRAAGQALRRPNADFTGEPIEIAPSVATSTALDASFSASPTGVLAYAARVPAGGRPTWFDWSGRMLDAAVAATDCVSVRLSPDGKTVAVTRSAPTENAPDIWLLDVEPGPAARFTFNQWLDISPVWSPDGNAVVFASSRTGRFTLFRRAARGGPDEAPFFATEASIYPDDWSPDGRYIVYSTDPPARSWDRPARRRHHARGPARELAVQRVSGPDFARWTMDRLHVGPDRTAGSLRAALSGGRRRPPRVHRGRIEPSWGRDGRELFYLAPDGTMMSVNVSVAGGQPAPGRPQSLFRVKVPGRSLRNGSTYAASADGQRFLVSGAGSENAASAITVIVNWRHGLRP